MKTLIASLLLLLATSAVSSQVVIKPKTVEYKRTGENVPDFKKTFEVRYPVIKKMGNKEAKRNLAKTIDYWSIFETTLEENLTDYHWLTSLDYAINYNKRHILDISLIIQGAGAYPSGRIVTYVVDQRTGQRIRVVEGFADLGGLLVKLDKAQKEEVRKAISDLKKSDPDDAKMLSDTLKDARFSMGTLDEYSVSDKGVTFIFDYGFPHVIQALEPEGRYFFSWEEIEPHVNRNGPLGRFLE